MLTKKEVKEQVNSDDEKDHIFDDDDAPFTWRDDSKAECSYHFKTGSLSRKYSRRVSFKCHGFPLQLINDEEDENEEDVEEHKPGDGVSFHDDLDANDEWEWFFSYFIDTLVTLLGLDYFVLM